MTKLAFDANRTGTPNTHKRRLPYACRLLLLAEVAACSSQPLASGDGGSPDSAVQPAAGTIVVSAATRRPRMTTLSVNYWNWMSSYEDDVSGTEAAIAPLRPAIMRVGGYNNDANMADPFDDAQFDRAVAYARAIGAEPLIQVPLLADIDGNPPTPSTAAAMVSYANVTKGYGIKYFSIGNEPDLYATQGSLTDSAKPAIPGYRSSDYCASVRAYVTAMKAVDGTIKIVGPDLSWHYIPGNDWLTPILQGCGDLFDIVSIHRYPFNAKQATLDAATGDATMFANTLASVRALMQAVGYGDKPLALTEMNVVYDATACQLGASPRTIGSALWLADGLGTAIQNDLWTSAIWDIGDNDLWAFGLVGPPPLHTPSPEYYAYQLYADHFGPTLLGIAQSPPNVRAYASRNQTDDATDIIVVNWGTLSAPLDIRVTGLTTAPSPATYTVPGLSISTVEIPDNGAALAWTYSEQQHQAGQGPMPLAPGASVGTDAGLPQLTNACSADASFICPKVALPSPAITTMGTTSGSNLLFGSPPYQWQSYTYGSNGQAAPTIAVTPDGNGLTIAGTFVPPVSQNWMGAGLLFNGTACIDGSSFAGVQFDFSGDLGGCALAVGANFSGDSTSTDVPGRGSCPFASDSNCYPPMVVVTPASVLDAGQSATTTFKVPFATMASGSPATMVDPSTILTVQWQLNAQSGGPGCSASFTVRNVAFY
jgi:hypothetical protein